MTKRTIIHLSLSVEGGIRNARSLRNCIKVDGCTLQTTEEVRAFLREQQAMGRKYIPCTDCDNFDYMTGCKGHTITVEP